MTYDVLGREIILGAAVAVAHSKHELKVGIITKITPKSIRVRKMDGSDTTYNGPDPLVRITGVLVLDGPDAMAYILKNGG